MGKMLEALLKLQSVERRLAEVRSRLRTESAAVQVQQGRIEQLRIAQQAAHDAAMAIQTKAAAVELDLKTRDQQVQKYHALLNTAKTNKEYANVLTQVNTYKADNSKLEDEALKLMQQVDTAKAQEDEAKKAVAAAEARLQELKASSSETISRLEKMLAQLQEERKAAAVGIAEETLALVNRINDEGDAMAKIEIIGRRAPFEYICSGCNMSIRAEHANALRTRDELRKCDCCGRILFLEEHARRETD